MAISVGCSEKMWQRTLDPNALMLRKAMQTPTGKPKGVGEGEESKGVENGNAKDPRQTYPQCDRETVNTSLHLDPAWDGKGTAEASLHGALWAVLKSGLYSRPDGQSSGENVALI